MTYRVTGVNRSTGGKMTLEVEADSRGAAERIAREGGMDVRHVEAANTPIADEPPAAKEESGFAKGAFGWVLFLAVAVIMFRYLQKPKAVPPATGPATNMSVR